MSLQPQAALIMAIQLASMPGSRLCDHSKESNFNFEDHSFSVDPAQQKTKPFLQSLFTSTPFSGLLQHPHHQETQQQQQQHQKRLKQQHKPKTRREPFSSANHWATDFWKLFSHFSNSHDDSDEEDDDEYEGRDEAVADNINPAQQDRHTNGTTAEAQHPDHSDDSYYQLDHDDYRLSDGGDESCGSWSSQEGMLLAISPLAVNLDLAVEHLHRAIVTQSVSEHKIDTWCRSVFQSWEGIGNSFLVAQDQFSIPPLQHKDISFINLDELTRFYQLVIHQEQEKDASKRKKNPRQVRIMEAISDSFETLLDRMALNVEALAGFQAMEDAELYHIRMMMEWCRSLMAVIQWVICCKEKKHKEEQDGLAALVAKLDDISTNQKRVASIASTSQIILTQKLIQVLSKIAHKNKSIIRKIMQHMLAR